MRVVREREEIEGDIGIMKSFLQNITFINWDFVLMLTKADPANQKYALPL